MKAYTVNCSDKSFKLVDADTYEIGHSNGALIFYNIVDKTDFVRPGEAPSQLKLVKAFAPGYWSDFS